MDITRVEAALAELNMLPMAFYRFLSDSRILLNKQSLAHLAIYEPRTFAMLVETARSALKHDDEIIDERHPADVHVNVDWTRLNHDGPFPRAREYPLGPAQSYKTPPRELTKSEY